MGALILLFSGTGNTKLLAKAVVEGLRESEIEAKAIDFKMWNSSDAQSTDLIGVAHPVYFWKPPLPVIRWLKSELPTGDGKPAFVFCSYSGILSRGLQISCELVLLKGYKLLGAEAFIGEEAHPRLRFPFYIPHRDMPDSSELSRAKAFGAKIAMRYKNWKENPERVPNADFPKDNGLFKLIGDATATDKSMRFWLGTKRVDVTRCSSCRICEHKCPTWSIKIDNRYPVFNESTCIGCGTCYNVCPEDAVVLQFSWGSRYRGPRAGDSLR